MKKPSIKSPGDRVIEELRRFRRTVEPFEDVEVEVDLQDALTCGIAPAPYVDVYPLADWIEDGWVRLRVVSPHHLVPTGHHLFLYDKLGPRLSGGESHQSLCALAVAYLHAIGKEFSFGGDSSCSYAGGWADVAAADGSIYVECGTLNTYKPIAAMLAGETLMVLPYTLGCNKLGERLVEKLDPFPDPTEADGPRWMKHLRLGRIRLGYVFEPKCELRPHPLKPPLGLRPPREAES